MRGAIYRHFSECSQIFPQFQGAAWKYGTEDESLNAAAEIAQQSCNFTISKVKFTTTEDFIVVFTKHFLGSAFDNLAFNLNLLMQIFDT